MNDLNKFRILCFESLAINRFQMIKNTEDELNIRLSFFVLKDFDSDKVIKLFKNIYPLSNPVIRVREFKNHLSLYIKWNWLG